MDRPRRVIVLSVVLGLAGCDPASLAPKPAPAARASPKVKSKPKPRPKSEVPAAEVPGPPAPEPPPKVETVFRPDDDRPRHDDRKLAALGIHRYESRRLVLYTDIPADQAQPLPPLVDQAYETWVEHFGPLPPARDRSEFQITGYLMADQGRFRDSGLLPEALPPFNHGRHRGLQFWMNDQRDAYYRAHLMLHEGTHCFMTIVPNPMGSTVWYMEGTAEYFGTHVAPPDQAARFGVMPHDREAFLGLGRIRMIRDDVAGGKRMELESVLKLLPDEFPERNECYAWSWGLCHFLATHPRYRERFRTIQQHVRWPTAAEDFRRRFASDWDDLQEEWRLFATNLCHGYDTERVAIQFVSGQTPKGTESLAVQADRGWQSSGVLLEMGSTYEIVATGQFTLAQKPRPWTSEPQGVSIRYAEGRPLGQLIACIRGRDPVTEPPGTTMAEVHSIGRGSVLKASVTGTLYLRLNEFWNELADNSGEVTVSIRPLGR